MFTFRTRAGLGLGLYVRPTIYNDDLPTGCARGFAAILMSNMSSSDMTFVVSSHHDQFIDLSFLNDDERTAILEVIERDETVRRHDQARIKYIILLLLLLPSRLQKVCGVVKKSFR